MNVAEDIVEWLYADQLRVDETWSYPLTTGFTWWPDEYCQTVEMVGEETGPAGETGYLLCVRTELLRDLDLTDSALTEMNALPMRCASMSGPVYDVEARRLDLWSLLRVTEANGNWMRYLLAAAAVTQLAEARLLAPVLAAATAALPAISEHPEGGLRERPAEMASAAAVFVDAGERPCSWPQAEFDEVATGHLAGRATVEPGGLNAEFSFGDRTAQFRIRADQPHPLYGNGLLCVLSYPLSDVEPAEGIRLALSLNAADLTRESPGYGIGSYSYDDGEIHFSGFVPNALYRPGLLPNLCSSAAARAQRLDWRFAEGGWDGEVYSLDPAILAARRERRQAAAPVVEPAMRGCPMTRARAESG